jgi:GxxExxY protein
MAEQYSTYKHTDTTDRIIKCFYDVYNTLGYGFLEKVYETALMHEMMKCGLFVEKQKQIKVYYDSVMVGEYYADLIVNEIVIIEVKAAETILEEHENQLVNYLKATEIEVGLLLNFGKKPGIKRKVFSNERKK